IFSAAGRDDSVNFTHHVVANDDKPSALVNVVNDARQTLASDRVRKIENGCYYRMSLRIYMTKRHRPDSFSIDFYDINHFCNMGLMGGVLL
ncbi:hypothetical protein, partial [Serratia fonticola]|uniref:hypothetical protein n=1 Tax=Serratia fonticola TaxID=47917 RepID=UPI001C0F1A36